MNKSLFKTLFAAMICMILFTGCGMKVHTYNTEDYVKIVVNGIDGSGRADIFPDRENFYALIDRDIYDGKATEVQLAQVEVNVYDSVTVNFSENTDGLSNGDRIIIKVTADNDRLKEYGIAFSENEYTYTVEGLEEAREIDLFKDIKLSYEGISPKAKASVEYTGDDDFIKNHVNIFIPYPNNIANGDMLTIKANYSVYTAEENNVIINETETTVEVSGLDEYLKEKADTSEIDKLFDEYIENALKDTDHFADGKEVSSVYLLKDAPSSANIYKILSCASIEPVEKILIAGNEYARNSNKYVVFYKLNFEIEKTENENEWIFGSGDDMYDGNDIGYKTLSDDVYFCVYLPDIVKKTDGTLEYDADAIDRSYYGYSAFSYNLTGHPYSDVRDQFLKDNSYFEAVYSE